MKTGMSLRSICNFAYLLTNHFPMLKSLRMKRFIILLPILLCCLSALHADAGGYKIRVKLDNYAEKQLILGFYYGEKPYVKDTVEVGADGYFTFQADTLLPCGVYLLVLKTDNSFIQFLLPADDQDFTLTTDAKQAVEKMKVKGSDDNQYFYDYLQYLAQLRPVADTLRAQLGRQKSHSADSIRLTGQLADMDKEVKKYQANVLSKHPGSMTSKIVKASLEPEIPDYFKGEEKAVLMQKREWYRQHFFDNLDISDPCMLRSPVLHGRIEQFVTKFTVQHPDSINQSVDYVLSKLKNNNENYKYYLVHFLNYYAKSNIVGMDAVYVHIAKEYYCKGQAMWTKKEDLAKICDNADRLEPILIGKTAPNISVLTQKNEPMTLWDVDADYTVLFFWDPDCSHCKKAAPNMVDFATKYHDRGVKVFAVCTAVTDKAPECWESIKEKGFTDFLFLNTYDPYIKSKYKTIYDVKSTPQIFILNRKHEILMKRIAAEQLDKVMEDVIRFQDEKKKQGGK